MIDPNVPRCGCTDFLMDTDQPLRWRKTRLKWAVKSYPSLLAQQTQDTIFGMAYGSWAAVAGVTFERVADPAQADLVVFTAPIDGPGRILAQAQLPQGDDGQLWLQLDSGEAWATAAGTQATVAILLLNVFAHETGHNLGLDHSRVPSSLMAPYYSPTVASPQANDDIPRIQALYGPAAPPPPPPGGLTLVLPQDLPRGTYTLTRQP